MNCADFSRWLDDGAPEADALAGDSHAGTCLSCARILEEARALDQLLAPLPATPPSTFVDSVMRKVASEPERVRPLGESILDASLPWWVQFLAEPAPACSFVLAAALIAWNGPFFEWLRTAGSSFAGAIERSSALDFLRGQLLANPAPAAALGITALAALTLLSIALYRGARWVASA